MQDGLFLPNDSFESVTGVLWPDESKIKKKRQHQANFPPTHICTGSPQSGAFLCTQRTQTVRQKGVAAGLEAFPSLPLSWKFINHPSANIMLRLSVITHGEHIPWQNFWFRDLLTLKSLLSAETTLLCSNIKFHESLSISRPWFLLFAPTKLRQLALLRRWFVTAVKRRSLLSHPKPSEQP